MKFFQNFEENSGAKKLPKNEEAEVENMEELMDREKGNKVSVCIEESVNRGNYQMTKFRLFITKYVKELKKEEIKEVFQVAKQAMSEK